MEKAIGFVGLWVMIGICWMLSVDRRRIIWKTVFCGLLLQLLFAFCILKTSWGRVIFQGVDSLANHILIHARVGAEFLFSKALGDPETAMKIFGKENGFFFAFQALPAIIFMSAFTAILYHLNIMQVVIWCMAKVMRWSLGISGAEACCAAANVFLGQTEAPLTVRPYLAKMTASELHCVMVGGMATISGGVLSGYVAMLGGKIDSVAAHFIAASVMSAPAAIMFAKILVPEKDRPETMGTWHMMNEKMDTDVVSACARGCSEGMRMAFNVAAMLIGFLSVLSLVQWIWDSLIAMCGGGEVLYLQSLVGYLCSPFAFLLGVPEEDILMAGQLLGEKTVLNEFVAYSHFAELLSSAMADCSMRTRVILSYALCGFANIGSIGVMFGGLGTLIPERKKDLTKLMWRALLGGTFASFSTAVIVGMLL